MQNLKNQNKSTSENFSTFNLKNHHFTKIEFKWQKMNMNVQQCKTKCIEKDGYNKLYKKYLKKKIYTEND